MNEELRKLIEEGESKRYHEIARNKKLYDGLIRAYSIMESIETVEQLGNYTMNVFVISILDYRPFD